MSLTQPLDMPWTRNARIGAAEAGFDSATALGRGMEADIIARIRLRYFEVLRRQAEHKAALEDQNTMEGIRDRIALRVETGEAPRFELIKAEAEMLNTQKNAYTAELRVNQARAALRALIGPTLPPNFSLAGKLQDAARSQGYRQPAQPKSKQRNPDLLRARAEEQKASRQLDHERAKRWPALSLRGSKENDPELSTSRVGVVMTIPIWDRRGGPIDEAQGQPQSCSQRAERITSFRSIAALKSPTSNTRSRKRRSPHSNPASCARPKVPYASPSMLIASVNAAFSMSSTPSASIAQRAMN